MSESLEVICRDCGKPFTLFKDGNTKCCRACELRKLVDEEYDYNVTPSYVPKVWEQINRGEYYGQ